MPSETGTRSGLKQTEQFSDSAAISLFSKRMQSHSSNLTRLNAQSFKQGANRVQLCHRTQIILCTYFLLLLCSFPLSLEVAGRPMFWAQSSNQKDQI